jgi:hypothetical protein
MYRSLKTTDRRREVLDNGHAHMVRRLHRPRDSLLCTEQQRLVQRSS